jgi:hypothetical protein
MRQIRYSNPKLSPRNRGKSKADALLKRYSEAYDR